MEAKEILLELLKMQTEVISTLTKEKEILSREVTRLHEANSKLSIQIAEIAAQRKKEPLWDEPVSREVDLGIASFRFAEPVPVRWGYDFTGRN